MTRTTRHSRFEIAGLTAALILTTGIGLAACSDDDSDDMDDTPGTEMMDDTPGTEMMDDTTP